MTDDAAWLTWRRSGLGASDVAAAVTGKYGGAYGVVASKNGVERQGNEDRKAVGHAWEERIADAVHAITGLYVVGEQTWCEHPDRPHHRCTIDGLLATAPEVTMDDVVAGLEIKTRHPNAGDASDYWKAQVQFQSHVLGLPRMLLAAATIGNDGETLLDIRFEWIEADPDRQAFLADVADWLWQHVQAGTYPPPDTPDALDAVKARHATADDNAETVDLFELEESIARHKAIKEAEKQAADELKVLEAQIREALGTAKKGTAPGWSVSLSAPSRVVTDNTAEAFLLVHPEAAKSVLDRAKAEQIDKALLDELKEAVGARTLRINRKKSA